MRDTLVSIVGELWRLHDKFDDKEHVVCGDAATLLTYLSRFIGRVEGLTDAIKYDSATGGRAQRAEAQQVEEEVTNEALLADADALRNELFAYIRDIKNQNKRIHELEQERNDLKAMLADAGIRNGVLEKRIDRLLDVIHDDCECESFEVCSNHVSGADCATGYDCKKCWRAWLEQEVRA